MPELPEVESIARRLRETDRGTDQPPALLGKAVVDAIVLWERTVAAPGPAEFRRRIRGQSVESISRRGKYLVIRLSGDWLLFHLRMSGDLIVDSPEEAGGPHDRLHLVFGGELRLRFNDARKFGRVWLLADPGPILGSLGPEPLEASLSAEEFGRQLAVRNRMVKPLLLDQQFLAGVGNIYADEALYLAGIHPRRPASSIGAESAAVLLDSIREVLTEGIRRNGASIDWVYRGGGFQEQFQVYQRDGEPCRRCGTTIERIVVGQRGTHFCPRCQPLPPDQLTGL